MEKTSFSVLTIRGVESCTEMLNTLMDCFNTKSASAALIKGGYEYLRIKKQLENEELKNRELRARLKEFEEGTYMFINGLEKIRKVTGSEDEEKKLERVICRVVEKLTKNV